MYTCYATSYGVKTDALKEISQRKVTQKLKKGRATFFRVIHCLNLTHIVIKFHQGQSEFHQREATQKLQKKRVIFFTTQHTLLTSYILL